MADRNDIEGVDNFADTASQGSREQHQTRVSKWGPALRIGLVAAALLLIVSVVGLAVYNGVTGQSRVTSAPILDDTPGGARQAQSREYQQSLEASNDRLAEIARQEEDTFVATPEGIPESRDPPTSNPPRPWENPETGVVGGAPAVTEISRPQIPQVRSDPPRQDPPARQDAQQPTPNPWTERILSQMGQVTDAWSTTTSMTGTFNVVEEQAAVTDGDASLGGQTPPGNDVLISAGTILYGQTLTRTTSDAQAPIVVEIVTGDWKGSRLIGGYQVQPGTQKMVVAFSQMSLPDGESVEVSAYAVDGKSAETAVASDVKRRYLQRYAPILGAAFLSGFANSASNVGSTISSNNSSTEIVIPEASVTQSLWAGAATAADAIAGDIVRNTPRGPLIVLAEGWPMGILFVAPVTTE